MDDGPWTVAIPVHGPLSCFSEGRMQNNMTVRSGARMMGFLGNRSVMILGAWLLVVAAGMLIAPVMLNQFVQQPVAVSTTALDSGAAGTRGYADRTAEEMQSRLATNPKDYAALSGLAVAYLQKARETNDPT